MAYDDEGFAQRVPNGSRIITSDDIFDTKLKNDTHSPRVRPYVVCISNRPYVDF